MTIRALTTDELNTLFPIRNLSEEHKAHIQKSLQTESVSKNEVIFSENSTDTKQLYLLEGSLKLTVNSKNERIIDGGSMEARFPLDNNMPHRVTATSLIDSTILYVENSLLSTFSNKEIDQPLNGSIDVTEGDSESILYNQLYFEVTQAINANRLEIPSIPETANKVRTAITDDYITSGKIAEIVQTDPAISAQVIKVANSPLFRGTEKIESLPNAITRLGLNAMGNLITSFTMRMVFNAKTKDIKARISELWFHSRNVACISTVISKKLKGFNKDKAMLVGLINDIGAIPVLTHADKHPNLINNPQEVRQAVAHLTPIIGKMVMQKWDFTEDFISVAAESKNWQRETNLPADYTDLVIISQLMSFQNTPFETQYPDPKSVPAYKRLQQLLRSSDDSLDVLESAAEEVADLQKLFN